MFVWEGESRQVGDVQNREPQTRWLSVNARLDTLSLNFPVCWVEIFQNVTQNLLSQNYVNLLYLYHTQSSLYSENDSKGYYEEEFQFSL